MLSSGAKVWRDPFLRMRVLEKRRRVTNRFDARIAIRLGYVEFFKYTAYEVQWICDMAKMELEYGERKWVKEDGILFGRDHLHGEHFGWCLDMAMEGAAREGNIELMQWFYKNGKKGSPLLMSRLLEDYRYTPNFEVLEWLWVNICKCRYSMEVVARTGRLEVVQWLSEKGAKTTTRAMDEAVGAGQLEVVVWLHENRKEGCTKNAMNEAANRKHLAIVEWLFNNRREGCSAYALQQVWSNLRVYQSDDDIERIEKILVKQLALQKQRAKKKKKGKK